MIMLIGAYIVTGLLIPILATRNLIRFDDTKDNEMLFYTSLKLDEIWAYLLYEVKNHTVSAETYNKWLMYKKPKHKYGYLFINAIFFNRRHCLDAYLEEYVIIEYDNNIKAESERTDRK